MEIRQSNIRCFGCNKYRPFYSRAFCNLMRERFGYCEEHNKIMQEYDYCDKWRRRRILCAQHVRLAMEAIDEIHEKITIVENMLKEEVEIEKLNKKLEKDNK